MEAHRAGREMIGAVLFARGPCPSWVTPLFSMQQSQARVEPLPRAEQAFPIPLNEAHERAVKEWAADDRLWTTQGTVEFNLRVFARVILAAYVLAAAPVPATGEEPNRLVKVRLR